MLFLTACLTGLPSESWGPVSEDMSIRLSEVQCTTNYRRRKASLNNPVFSDREFGALNAVDAYLGATRGAFDESLDVLSRGLWVRFKDKYDYQVW